MPVSDINNIVPILNEVIRLQPKSILDLGIGVGKYGVLCREVLDGVNGRVDPKDWQVEIVGVEGFPGYRNPVWGAYNEVFPMSIDTYLLNVLQNFDLILLLDVLEHYDADSGYSLVKELCSRCKNLIVSVPLGNCPQGAVFGNELERHRTTFNSVADFEDFCPRVLHKGTCLVMSMKGTL